MAPRTLASGWDVPGSVPKNGKRLRHLLVAVEPIV